MAAGLRAVIILKHVVKTVAAAVLRFALPLMMDGWTAARRLCVMALPASTMKKVAFVPSLHDDQWRAITTLRYGPATRVLLQFRSAILETARPTRRVRHRPADWRRVGTQRAAARQAGDPDLLAGGNAAREVQVLIRTRAGTVLVRQLACSPAFTPPLRHDRLVDKDPWARGGYAVFDPQFDPVLRSCSPARPRIVFAGEHTSASLAGVHERGDRVREARGPGSRDAGRLNYAGIRLRHSASLAHVSGSCETRSRGTARHPLPDTSRQSDRLQP
jgi:monoamine oxidase